MDHELADGIHVLLLGLLPNVRRRIFQGEDQAGPLHRGDPRHDLQPLELLLQGRRHVLSIRHALLVDENLVAQLLHLLLEVLVGLLECLIVTRQRLETVGRQTGFADRSLGLESQSQEAAQDETEGRDLDDPRGLAGPNLRGGGLGSRGFRRY